MKRMLSLLAVISATFLLYSSPEAASQTKIVGGIEFVRIPVGCFMMGSNEYDSEKPVHRVCLDGFWMAKYETTQAQYEAITGTNPSYFKNKPNNPVEQVSWNDANEFAEKFSSKHGVRASLPTEAQWEYAARGGTTTRYYWGDRTDFSVADQYAVYHENSYNKKEGHPDYGTHRVGSKKPNAYGLYDMAGNVWEWCRDWYDANYYNRSPEKNPMNSTTAEYRVLRGGGWYNFSDVIRSAIRNYGGPDYRDGEFGFRLVLSAP